MGFNLTNSKEVALRGFLHEWLKDQTTYCNRCGNVAIPRRKDEETNLIITSSYEAPKVMNDYQVYEDCCESPQIGRNREFIDGLIYQNKAIQDGMQKATGATKDNSFRWGISITPRLLHDMEEYSLSTLKEPLWKDAGEMQDFMGSFPEFRVCKTI